MATVKSRNVYADTSFILIRIKDGKLDVKNFSNVGRKGNGIEFINGTKNVSKDQYVLIGPHLDDSYDIEPTVVTDIDEQRQRVFDYLKGHFVTFKPEDVDL